MLRCTGPGPKSWAQIAQKKNVARPLAPQRPLAPAPSPSGSQSGKVPAVQWPSNPEDTQNRVPDETWGGESRGERDEEWLSMEPAQPPRALPKPISNGQDSHSEFKDLYALASPTGLRHSWICFAHPKFQTKIVRISPVSGLITASTWVYQRLNCPEGLIANCIEMSAQPLERVLNTVTLIGGRAYANWLLVWDIASAAWYDSQVCRGRSRRQLWPECPIAQG